MKNPITAAVFQQTFDFLIAECILRARWMLISISEFTPCMKNTSL